MKIKFYEYFLDGTINTIEPPDLTSIRSITINWILDFIDRTDYIDVSVKEFEKEVLSELMNVTTEDDELIILINYYALFLYEGLRIARVEIINEKNIISVYDNTNE